MTKKTPITDKLQKVLSVIEKISLSNTLDTGFDTSNFTKNWTQSGEDFDKFFGIDKFKKKYGDVTLDATEFGVASKSAKDTSNRVRSLLFSTPEVKNHRVSLLHVYGASVKKMAESNIKPSPYIWSTTAYEFLNEENSPFQIGTSLGDFWRMSVSNDEVSIRSSKFGENFYFSSATPINKMGQFLHSDNGTFPKQLSALGGGEALQSYATANFEAFISEAVESVKALVKNEESLYDLDQLKTVSFSQLPSFIHDAILVGICDAANTNVYKDNRSKSLEANKVGCIILQPTQYVLAGLENIVQAVKKEDEIYLTPELITAISSKLNGVKSASNPYMLNDKNFLRNLAEAIKLRKWDAEKAARKTSTMLYFALSLMINQINAAFSTRVRSRYAAKFYFGELNEGVGGIEKRDKDLLDTLINPSLDKGEAPMAILRARAGGQNDDHVLIIEQFVIKYLKGIGSNAELGTLKQAGLTSGIHNSIYAKAAKTGPTGHKETTKQDYIEQFKKVQDSSSSILNANFGKDYWLQILETCYVAETNTFKDGVFFVGVAPLFWDTVEGKEIYVSYNTNPETFKITLPYLIADATDHTKFTESNIMYEETLAAAVYYDRIISDRNPEEVAKLKEASKGDDPKNPEGSVPVANAGVKVLVEDYETSPKVKARIKEILENPEHNFIPLSQIRLELLTQLYSKSSAEFEDLAKICKTVIGNIIATVGSGFWSVDKKDLALYNPWDIGDKIKRFNKNNTNPMIMIQEKNRVIKAYKDISNPEDKK